MSCEEILDWRENGTLKLCGDEEGLVGVEMKMR